MPSPLSLFFFSLIYPLTLAGKLHLITFRSPNLFPESLAWDPSAQHFLVGSMRHATLHTVSDAGIIQPFISDPDFSGTGTYILGIAVDSHRRRILAVIHSPTSNALASYDLRTRRRIFLAPLSGQDPGDRTIANDVAVHHSGEAFVTNTAGNFIWKVTLEGEPSIFSTSALFRSQHVDESKPYSWCGLNGIVYSNKGYLLAVQTNSGKVFRVDPEDGTARVVSIPEDLTEADGIVERRDGVIVVVSHHTAWFLKSDDGWARGAVYDRTALNVSGFPSAVAVREGEKLYVLNGAVNVAMDGGEREEFSIEEIESGKEREGEPVWIFVLIGLGLAYFCYWRFQMGQLMRNMNKKIE